MQLKLYNTMSREIEVFVPRNAPEVKLYACGLTVYDYTHLGHLRKYTMDDILIRTLKYFKYDVTFVQNITDVGHLASDADTGEDKLEKGAKKYGQSVYDIAHKFEDYFFDSMDKMGNIRPGVSCRATDHIAEQLQMVLDLEKKGFAYVIAEDGAYFDTAKMDDYGKLARLNLEEQKAGARVEVIAGKRNPADFALWKFEKPGENRAMVWPSPWAKRSFPGWHIECSAMSKHYLGDQIDIHTGGIDHIPVHHTNEIAQTEAVSGKKPSVKYWVHHNFLRIENEKMSKSLGNFFTIDDVIAKGYHPKAIRFLFLSSHYRSELNFTWDSLAGTQKAFDKLLAQVATFPQQGEDSLLDIALGFQERFEAALANDLDTPKAMAVFWEALKSDISGVQKSMLLDIFDAFLGFNFKQLAKEMTETKREKADLPKEVQSLVEQRETARFQKDWKRADALRESLLQQGFLVEDTAKGQKVSLSSKK